MIKKVLIGYDVHLDTKVPKVYKLFKQFVADFKPNEIILGGDFMDVSALSAWDYDKKRKMEGRRYIKEYELANKELDFLQKHTKKIIYLEGNHENRVQRYLDKNPEMEGIIEVPIVLNLKKRNIEYLKMNTYYHLGHIYFTHGLYTNEFHAKKTLMNVGKNIVTGHLHTNQTYMMSMMFQKPIMAYSMPCLCNKSPDYLKNRPSNWMSGFGVMYIDTKTGLFNLYVVNIIKNEFIWNGKKYK